MDLKEIQSQTIVITGASSGIGLVTARKAAEKGARLMLCARNGEALEQLAVELRQKGADIATVAADVGKDQDLRQVAQLALERFGGFDTWVNNAGVSIYGELEKVPFEDSRRLFETNFWGVVHGSQIALEHLKSKGGAIINVGSVLSDTAMPLQGMYSASKHAVKGYTDALRMEVEKAGYPVSVTLIKPGAIDTPYPEHARNYLEVQPKNPQPLYLPDVVADVILYCASNPESEVTVGGGGKLISLLGKYAPRLRDRLMESFVFEAQQSEKAKQEGAGSLYETRSMLDERGKEPRYAMKRSAYTSASLHPWRAALILGAAAVGIETARRHLTRGRSSWSTLWL